MHQLPYLAAHQLIHQRYADEFESPRFPSDVRELEFDRDLTTPAPRVRVFRVAVATLLRRTADRVAPA